MDFRNLPWSFGCTFTALLGCTAAPNSSPQAAEPRTDAGTTPNAASERTATVGDAATDAAAVPTEFRVLNGAGNPLSTLVTGRAVVSQDGQSLLCATNTGVARLDLSGTLVANFALPPQNQAPAVSALATRVGSPDVFFMTQGFDAACDGTLGSIDTKTGLMRTRSAILDTGLGSILVAPTGDGLGNAVWTVDPAAAPPSVLAYKFSDIGTGDGGWRPAEALRVPLPKLDLDGNGRDEIVLPTNMVFLAPHAAVVSFALAPAPANTVGGLFFFDPIAAVPLATLLIPARAGANSGTVMETAFANGHLFVIADEGNMDAKHNTVRTQGTVSVYDLPANTFVPERADNSARVIAPRAQFGTSTNHPVALAVMDTFVVAMTFPSKTAAALDLVDLAGTGVVRSLQLGVINPGKGREPRRMERSGNRLYIGTDIGLLVAGTQ
jgi:hypothetical protein